MQISVGPLLYLWERNATLQFYADLCDAPVDIVYLGEVVCSKRRLVRREDWLEIAQALTKAGKEVVVSTLALIEAESELSTLSRIVGTHTGLVEANDYAAVNALAGRGFVAGPHLNVYNEATLALLAGLGACRWVAPVELSLAAIAALSENRPAGMQFELFAYGRLPLAFSARCFTARKHRRQKDECEFICRQYADGLTLYSRENQPFLTLNGIQTQSAAVQNLHPQIHAIRLAGVDIVRLSPQSKDFFSVVRAFRDAADGVANPAAFPESSLPGGYCDGYSSGAAGLVHGTREPRS